MIAQINATPLLAIDAVALDTETTGLDTAHARVIEIAGVPVARGRVHEDAAWRRHVHPGGTIPPASTVIHGITDADVASAEPFSAVWPAFETFLGPRVTIGYAIGFDLAVLESESARAGMPWWAPRSLCVRLLSQVASPEFGDFSLEQLAARLRVEIVGRHSAIGDAAAAGRIFFALVPLLRDKGVRTLAEAEQACRRLTSTLEQQHLAGWAEPAAPKPRDHAPFSVDTHLFRLRVSDLMSAPKVASPSISIGAAIQRLARERTSSLFLAAPANGAPLLPGQTAIVTERDLLKAIADRGPACLAMPASTAASSPVLTVHSDAYLYRAIGRMRGLRLRHLGVTDENGHLCGAVSARDLLHQRAEEAIWLGDEIDQAEDLPTLAQAWTRLPLIAEALTHEEMTGTEVARVISRELGALTGRAAVLAERRMIEEGLGAAPCPYAVAVLGSAGRGESLLAMDQDNAIVFAHGEPDGPEDRWFAELGKRLSEILHEVGVPFCRGGVMASNPAWRGSQATWRDRVGGWVQRSRAEDLMSIDIFFDMRAVEGEASLATALRREAFEVAAGELAFAKLLAEAAGTAEPVLKWFGRIRTEEGRVDLKKAGLFAIVSTARVLAIRHHITERSTPGRLIALRDKGIGSAADLDGLREAHAFFMTQILLQQVEDLAKGIPPSNAVAMKRLDARARGQLTESLKAAAYADEVTRENLFNR